MDNKPPGTEPDTKCKNGGLAICFSACEDGQMAADTAVRIFGYIFILFLQCNTHSCFLHPSFLEL